MIDNRVITIVLGILAMCTVSGIFVVLGRQTVDWEEVNEELTSHIEANSLAAEDGRGN